MKVPGSWAEMAESLAFVLRAPSLALHPVVLGVAGAGALAMAWAAPADVRDALPWSADATFGGVLRSWVRLLWCGVAIAAAGGVVARWVAARPTRAAVRTPLPRIVSAAAGGVVGLAVVLVLVVLLAWVGVAIGRAIGGGTGAALSALSAAAVVVVALVGVAMALLGVPSIAASDVDAPDGAHRAAAYLMARPGLSAALLAASLGLAWVGGTAAEELVRVGHALATDAASSAADVPWLATTVFWIGVLAVGLPACTLAMLSLREAVDREDRTACWDASAHARAVREAAEARAMQVDPAGRSAESGVRLQMKPEVAGATDDA